MERKDGDTTGESSRLGGENSGGLRWGAGGMALLCGLSLGESHATEVSTSNSRVSSESAVELLSERC